MDALEFARAKKRMCLLYLEDCGKCPLGEVEDCSLGSHFTTDERDKTIIETVEAWTKEHPTNEEAIKKIDPLEIAIEALYKQIPLKPDYKTADGRRAYYCNVCGCGLCDDDGSTFCSFCGQKQDWSEE